MSREKRAAEERRRRGAPAGSPGRAKAAVEVWRGGRLETRHRVSLALADRDGRLVAGCGDARLATYWRSAAKPFQALPLVASGAADALGFGARELALACASHSGEAPHRAVAAHILSAARLSESDLLCGTHPPMHPASWRELGRERPTPLWNNCSGKHAAMLACCRHRGWPTFDYRRPEHPLQVEIVEVVRLACGLDAERLGQAIDGCGVPVFHLRLSGMATAYARLADPVALPEPWGGAARRVVEAIVAEPFFLAGTDRLCTRLVEASAGRVVAKVGAAGVFCAALLDRRLGLAIKVEDGSSHAAAVALVEALRQLGALEPSALPGLVPFAPGRLSNHTGAHVGEVVARLDLVPD